MLLIVKIAFSGFELNTSHWFLSPKFKFPELIRLALHNGNVKFLPVEKQSWNAKYKWYYNLMSKNKNE